MNHPAFRFIVCSNGFGHLRRVLKVVSALNKQSTGCSITVECKAKNLAQIAKDPEIAAVISAGNLHFNHAAADLEPEYNGHIRFQEFESWLRVLNPPAPGEVVVLDNEAILLHKFPDAVLMGSFLWSDVIESKKWMHLEPYVEAERSLIKARNPFMLGLSDMATDRVRRGTRFVPLPWFVHASSAIDDASKKHILLTMGGSGKEKEFLDLPLLAYLEENPNRVFTDERLRETLNGRFSTFDFATSSFQKIKLVIGRPGIGILTECVQYQIPIACVYEKDNSEMVHNAACVKRLGIGLDLMQLPHTNHTEQLANIMDSLTLPEKYSFQHIAYNGAETAANWLLNHWNNTM